MESLNLDLGAVEYRIPGGGVLRFNPADPNVYGRFLEIQKGLEAVHTDFRRKAKNAREGSRVLALLQETDRQLKQLLEQVFPGNDLDAALGGVNLLAMCADGKTVAENLLTALEGVLSRGAKDLVEREAKKLKEVNG